MDEHTIAHIAETIMETLRGITKPIGELTDEQQTVLERNILTTISEWIPTAK